MRVLVTGVTRGIGRSMVEHLVAGGWTVAAVGRNERALGALAVGWGEAVETHVADASDVGAMASIARAADPLDLVVANAGALGPTGPLWETDPHQWWRGVEANLGTAHSTASAVIPAMVARGCGRLVLVSSGIGNNPGPWMSSYATSKAAVTVLGESLQAELVGTGVSCFVISPGMVRTEMTQWPETLTRHRPELADPPDQRFTPVQRVLDLLDEIASGRLDGLAGRFLHATDDRATLLDAVGPIDHRARTLRLSAAYDGDPMAR